MLCWSRDKTQRGEDDDDNARACVHQECFGLHVIFIDLALLFGRGATVEIVQESIFFLAHVSQGSNIREY